MKRIYSDEELKERRAQQAKEWRLRNPEKAKQVGRDSAKRWRTERRDEYLSTKRAWQAANQDKVRLSSRRALCKKHGITLEIYTRILERQGGVCAICLGKDTEKNGMLCIDHDHTCCDDRFGCPRCIRGLICTKCNQGLGCFGDNTQAIEAALAYLNKPRFRRLCTI